MKSMLQILMIFGFLCSASGGNFEDAVKFVLAHEGSAYVIDRGGHPCKYGVNQRWHKDVDVKNLTEAQARKIMWKYWIKTGAYRIKDKALAIVVFDTGYMFGPGTAKEMFDGCNDFRECIVTRIYRHKEVAHLYKDAMKYLNTWVERSINLYDYVKEIA